MKNKKFSDFKTLSRILSSEDKIKCPECGISVPNVPEDATHEETLCNQCYERLESEEDR